MPTRKDLHLVSWPASFIGVVIRATVFVTYCKPCFGTCETTKITGTCCNLQQLIKTQPKCTQFESFFVQYAVKKFLAILASLLKILCH